MGNDYLEMLRKLYLFIEKKLSNKEGGTTLTKLINDVWKDLESLGNNELGRVKSKQSIRDAVIALAKDGKLKIEYREPKTLYIILTTSKYSK